MVNTFPEPIDAVMINLRLEVGRADKAGQFPVDHIQSAGLAAEGVASAMKGAMSDDTAAYKAGIERAAVACLRALVELEKKGL